VTLDERPPKLRWPRSHRFALSERGRTAELEYREKIVTARAEPGRASFDAARTAWAASHGLNVDDGLYLAELAGGPVTLPQIVAALETCGKNRVDAIAALERLADAGMISSPPA
jgi:hypothetical protein